MLHFRIIALKDWITKSNSTHVGVLVYRRIYHIRPFTTQLDETSQNMQRQIHFVLDVYVITYL